MAHAETARSRRRTVDEAGFSTTSGISVLAGTLVAFGAVALIAAAAGALGSTLGIDTDGISTDEWRNAGIAGAAAAALVLFASFFFGGYTAGRMSRRAGARHGILVFVLSVVLMAGIGLAAWGVSDTSTSSLEDTIEDTGAPTDADTWSDIGIGAAIAAGVAMLLGSIAGGIRGDRWHGRLAEAVRTNRDAHVADRDVRASDGMVDTEPFDRTRSIDLRDDTVDADADRTQLSVEEERERAARS